MDSVEKLTAIGAGLGATFSAVVGGLGKFFFVTRKDLARELEQAQLAWRQAYLEDLEVWLKERQAVQEAWRAENLRELTEFKADFSKDLDGILKAINKNQGKYEDLCVFMGRVEQYMKEHCGR